MAGLSSVKATAARNCVMKGLVETVRRKFARHVIVAKMFRALLALKALTELQRIHVRTIVAACWTVRTIAVKPSAIRVSASLVRWQCKPLPVVPAVRFHWKNCMSEMEPFSEGPVQIQSPPAASLVSVSSSVVCQVLFMNARLFAMKVLVHPAPWKLQSSAGVVPWTAMFRVLSLLRKQMKLLVKSHVRSYVVVDVTSATPGAA